MKKAILLAVMVLLTVVVMNGATSNMFKFSSDRALVYMGSTEVIVPELEIDPSISGGLVTYSIANSGVATVNAQTGELTIEGPGKCNVNASYSKNSLTAKYELTVIDPTYGEYHKVTGTSELASGKNNYVLIDRPPKSGNAQYVYYLTYKKDGSSLVGMNYPIDSKIMLDNLDNENVIYSQIMNMSDNPPGYAFSLNTIDAGETSVYSLECKDLENTDDYQYISYPQTSSKYGNLILSNTERLMTIDFNETGIVMSFVDDPERMIGSNKSIFKNQNKTEQTSSFGLYKYHEYKTPDTPIVKINDSEVTGDSYNATGNSAIVKFEALEGVLVYYTWNSSSETAEESIAKAESETTSANWIRYDSTQPIQLSENGELKYYSEQYGKKAETKTLNVTFNTTTSVLGVKSTDSADAVYYTIEGQKLKGKPNKAGVYVVVEEGTSKTIIIK